MMISPFTRLRTLPGATQAVRALSRPSSSSAGNDAQPSIHELQSQPRRRTATEVSDESTTAQILAQAVANAAAHHSAQSKSNSSFSNRDRRTPARKAAPAAPTKKSGGLAKLLSERRTAKGAVYDADARAIADLALPSRPASSSHSRKKGDASTEAAQSASRDPRERRAPARTTPADGQTSRQRHASAFNLLETLIEDTQDSLPTSDRFANRPRPSSSATTSAGERKSPSGPTNTNRGAGAGGPRRPASSKGRRASPSAGRDVFTPSVNLGPLPKGLFPFPSLDFSSLLATDLASRRVTFSPSSSSSSSLSNKASTQTQEERLQERREVLGDYSRLVQGVQRGAVEVARRGEKTGATGFARSLLGRNSSVGVEGREKLVKEVEKVLQR